MIVALSVVLIVALVAFPFLIALCKAGRSDYDV